MDPYDKFPYESIAFPETHPTNLAVLGRLFGLDTANPDTCRVLELGCASGGNLTPMAWHCRNARFLGIDLSPAQIDDGQALIDRLGLTNVELRQGDILALDGSLGEFDYVIAHGVYSWVPDAVREHLLDLVPQLLAPGGLFYVSFNTLPGWRMRGMLRDILTYACRNESAPQARLEAAQAALDRLNGAIEGLGALSTRYLREEIENIRDAYPSYLLFEYLAEHNHAFLFNDFAADTERHGLRYLCDTDLRTLFPSTFGEGVDRALADIEDGYELEQWLDLVTNRNFRQSVLCRADATLDDEIDLDRFARLSFCADLHTPEHPKLQHPKSVPFTTPSGNRLEVSHPLTKALVVRLIERYPDCLPLAELMPAAARDVASAGGGKHASEASECLTELFSLYAHRGISARPKPLRWRLNAGDKPRASALAVAQVESGAKRVATLHHGNLDLDGVAARLIGYLDGTRTPEQAIERLVADLEFGELAPPPGVEPRQWGHQRLVAQTRAAVSDLLALFARYGILEAEVSGD